ncbi:unnamed protein product, partial [Closterium sp. Yama58-4]
QGNEESAVVFPDQLRLTHPLAPSTSPLLTSLHSLTSAPALFLFSTLSAMPTFCSSMCGSPHLSLHVQNGKPFPFDATEGPGYVWHCHMLEHEDNDMMRPLIMIVGGLPNITGGSAMRWSMTA